MTEFGPQLVRMASAMTADRDEAEDAVQEVWLIALRRHQVVSTSRHVGAWLYGVLANVVRDRRRKAQRRLGLLRRFWPRDHGRVGGDTVTGTLEEEQLRELVWREIVELPDLQRRVVLLRVVEGLSTDETARAIGRAEGTVKSSLYRAMRRLRARLSPHVNLGVVKGGADERHEG